MTRQNNLRFASVPFQLLHHLFFFPPPPMSEPQVATAEGGPSKNALKKAQKEKEKAAKKAAAKKAEQENRAAAQVALQEDTAKDNYGTIPSSTERPTITSLQQLTGDSVGKEVTVVTRVHNSRSQSAKLAFLMLRQQGETIQAVVAAAGDSVSRQMVKWSIGIHVNSVVRVSGVVSKPEPPVASATLSELELHVTKIYMVAEAAEQIPIQVKDLERPNERPDEEAKEAAGEAPIVSLATRLDNRTIDLQTKCNQAILSISHGVEILFQEYLSKRGFRSVHTPKLLGAATEGGASVFEIPNYFGKQAFLAQSPQFYKQMLICGDVERVFEIGPVFRAENSNSHRHLTEVSGSHKDQYLQPTFPSESLGCLCHAWTGRQYDRSLK
jgi:lysyl-tRNA synthetase class II